MHPEQIADRPSSPTGVQGRSARATGRALEWAVLAVALGILVILVLMSPDERLYDERRYFGYVELVEKFGLSADMLRNLPGAVGPLYGVFHLILQPVTGLDPVLMRLATVGLLLVVMALTALALRLSNAADPGLMAASILIVPMTWVLSGMALTTMPALVFVTANIVLQLRGISALERGESPLALFAVAGVSLGIAIWGRQTAGVLVAPPLLLAMIDRRFLVPVVVQAAIAGAMGLPLLVVWHGPNPPLDDTVSGWNPGNVLLTLGYLFAAFVLLVQHPRRLFGTWSLAGLAVASAANVAFSIARTFPLASIVDNYLSERGMLVYGVACGSILIWMGGAFVVWIAGNLWRNRRDARIVLSHASVLVLTLVPLVIGNEYSSRYAADALPYLMLVAAPHRGPPLSTAAKALVGCAIGIAVLVGYYWDPLTSDIVRTRAR